MYLNYIYHVHWFEEAEQYGVVQPSGEINDNFSVLEMERFGVELHPVMINMSLSFNIFWIISHSFHKLGSSFTFVLFTQMLAMTAT